MVSYFIGVYTFMSASWTIPVGSSYNTDSWVQALNATLPAFAPVDTCHLEAGEHGEGEQRQF